MRNVHHKTGKFHANGTLHFLCRFHELYGTCSKARSAFGRQLISSENCMRYYVHHRFQKGKDQQRVCKFFISMTLSIIIPPGQKILDEDTRALFTGTEFKASVQAKSKLVKLLT